MNNNRIYLDYNATTPCDERVVEAMLPWFHENFGNAASRSHAFGWEAEEAVKNAREKIANLLLAEPEEIVFTSGATEACNLAIKGVFEAYHIKGRHIVTLKTEHKAVLDTCTQIEKRGADVTYLDVRPDGLVDLQQLENAIRPDTLLVVVMWANNETGVIQNMAHIADICRDKDTLLFTDATQAVGKIPVEVRQSGIGLLAMSGHKFYGPKGIGALYISRRHPRVKIIPQITGGGHERGMRSGTLNVPAIVGLGKAAEIAADEMEENSTRLRHLRNKLENTLMRTLKAVVRNGHADQRLAHTSNLSFKFTESEQLIASFNRNIAVASGSACTSATLSPSHVLTAMGLASHLAQSAIRFSLGKYTTEPEIDYVIEAVQKSVQHLRASSPVWQMYNDGVDVEALL